MTALLTKSQHLGEQLKQELASDQLVLGQKFHSIPELSKRYNVSTATAHKVVSSLVRDGYLSPRRGHGYFLKKRPAGNKIHSLYKTQLRTKTILLVNDFGHVAPPAKVMAGIQDACEKLNCHFEVISFNAADLVEKAEREDVAGLVLCWNHEGAAIGKIKKPKICVGHWSDPDDGVISFVADAERAAMETVRHLCGLGHERIAFLAASSEFPPTTPFCSQVIAGLRRGFQTYGLPWSDDLVHVDLKKSEAEATENFVKTFAAKRITAAFVPVWFHLHGLVQRLAKEGLSVPKDLSLVAYGESPLTPLVQPPMTSFDLSIREVAEQAAQMLIEHDRDGRPLPKTRFVTFPVELVVRHSTAVR